MIRRRTLLSLAAAAVPGLAVATPAQAEAFPTTIALPNGFKSWGIAIGPGPFAYFTAIVHGDIYRVDLRTGRGKVISRGSSYYSAGLERDGRGRLFLACGYSDARVLDLRTGEVIATYPVNGGASFLYDVALTDDAAWFSDSEYQVLWKVPLRNGELPKPSEVRQVDLTGDYQHLPEPDNANGLVLTPDRCALLLMQSNTGRLFRVDPATGVAKVVDLGGLTLDQGDGLHVRGRTVYVAQGRLNRIAVVHLDWAGRSGRLVKVITDPRFDTPSAVAVYGGRLYVPNSRFGTAWSPDTPYSAVSVRL